MKHNCTMIDATAALFTCTINIFHTFKDVTIYQKVLNTKTNNFYAN